MKRYIFIFTILSCSLLKASSQDANLVRENVTIKLDSSNAEVSGEYYFRNPLNQPVSQTVFFPYQFEKQSTKVDTISIFNISDNTFLKPKRKMSTGVYFLLNLNGNEEKKVRVMYIQEHDGQSFTYILASARYQPKPLSQATYNLKAINKIEVDSFSMKPDNSGNIQDWVNFQWHRMNFKPTRDLIIYFKKKK